jgi:hypothetical protein
MKHPSSPVRKILCGVSILLAALLILVALLVACNWNYIRPILQGMGVLSMSAASTDEWDELEQQIAQDFAQSATEEPAQSTAVSLPDSSTPEPDETPAQEEPTAGESPAASETPGASETPAVSETPAATQTPTATQAPVASQMPTTAPTTSPTASPTPAEPDYEAEVQQCVAEMKVVEKKFQSRLYGIIVDALNEYLALPVESRSLLKKVSIILSKRSALTAMEKECDAEVADILVRMRAALTASGQDDTLAKEAEQAYKKKKSDTIAELTRLTYSGADGKGTAQKWVEEHSDWA